MTDRLIAGACVLVLDGREYVRHGTDWYDAKTLIRVTVVDAGRLDSLLRKSPDSLESMAIEARRQLEERHNRHLERHGISNCGRGPSTRSVHRSALCWTWSVTSATGFCVSAMPAAVGIRVERDLARRTRRRRHPGFAERLPRAANWWVQASLDQKQRLQQMFYPEGVAFDGIDLIEPLQPHHFSSAWRSARTERKVWWARMESNHRPPACEADALPLSHAPTRRTLSLSHGSDRPARRRGSARRRRPARRRLEQR